jgi:hypothetical protein
MMTFSIFKSSAIEAGKRVLKVIQFGAKTAKESAPFGYDGNPIADMTAIYGNTSNNSDTVIIGYINKNQIAGVGETRLYSLDGDGAVKSFVWMKSNGVLELNGNTYSGVRFEPLDSGLQNQTNLINIELGKIAASIASLGGVYTTAPITTNIATSKSETVKIK